MLMNRRCLRTRLRTTTVFCCLVACCSSARAGTVTGRLQGPGGLPIKNATLDFKLQQAGLMVGTGAIVPVDAACYTSTDGSVVGLPNPLNAPAASANYGAGSLPAGEYYVETTFYSGGQETLPSPESIIQLTGTGSVVISPPAGFPANAVGMRVYVGTSPEAETLQGETVSATAQYSVATPLATASDAPQENSSECVIAFNDTIIPYSGYNVSLIAANGNAYPGWPQAWQLNGGPGGTVNVSAGAPLWNGVVIFPQPLFAQPLNHGPQSIAGPLSMSGYTLTSVGKLGIGTATPAFAADVAGMINTSSGYLYQGAAPSNHILLGNGSAYVDSATVPASAISGIFYRKIGGAQGVLPQENMLAFSSHFALSDNAGTSTSVDLGSSGVAAGSYSNADITVDSYGRITQASSGQAIPSVQSLVLTAGICTTPNTANGVCTFLATWPNAFADTGYAVTCNTGIPTPNPSSINLYTSAKTTTGFTVTLQTGEGSGTQSTTVPEVDCIGVHP
jgi:hypothetical protein